MKVIHEISIGNFANLSLKGLYNTLLITCNKDNDNLLLMKKILRILIIKNALIIGMILLRNFILNSIRRHHFY